MKNYAIFKTTISALLVNLFFIVSNVNAQQYTLLDDDVVVENGIIMSCSYDFELKNIIIPETLDGQTVIGIYGGIIGSFWNKDITSVELPSTIEVIDRYAFYGNNISNLDLSGCTALVSVGESAFYYNSIDSLDISNCTALSTIGSRAFYSNKIKSVDLSGCTALVSIGADAFMSNQITEVDLTGCTNLLWIGSNAFYLNPLAGFALPEVTYDGTVYNIWKDGNNNSYTAGTDMATNLYTLYNPFIQYTLTSDDVVVESGVIMSCSYDFELKNIIIPETLDGQTVIGIYGENNNGSFFRKSITSVELPSTIEIIVGWAFYGNNISNLDLSGCTALVSIGEYAFSSNSIASLDISNCTALNTIDKDAFSFNIIKSVDLSGCTALVSIGESAFYYNSIDSLDMSNCMALTTIDEDAFRSNKIKSVDLTKCANLLIIGRYAFYGNPSLTDFSLPDPVIPGYFYSNWIDNQGGSHDAVESVKDLTYSYTRVMPEIIDIIDVYAPTEGNKEISLIGKNFEDQKNNKKLLFNGIECLSYNTWSDTLITVVCPPNPEGTVKIEIPLENNIVYSSPIQFYYADEQVIPICGNISGNWEAGATYLITCNVTIDYIDTLIIEEGVKILAMPEENVRLICNGILEVNGTQDNPVLFTSANKVQGSWNGISIYGIYDSCKFNYCIVEYASTAISLYARAWGCFLQRNYSEFKNCIIRNNSKNAFYCVGEGDYEFGCSNPKTGACSPLIQNCQIYNNGLNGIELVAYDGYKSKGYIGAKVYNNLIYNNRNGIYCHGDDNVEPKIINNVITKNSVSGINSIHQNFTVENYQIANNIISNNGIGIINEDTTAIILNNNNLWSNALDFQGMFQDELNIFENSLFIDFQNNDFNLQSSSPCINSGSNDFVDFETDFSGKIRIFDGLGNGITKVDIGAFEYGAPCSQIEIERTICSGDSIQIGDSIFSQTGNYTVTFSNIHGCDSIVNLDLTVQTVDASVSQSGFTLTAHASDADYKWLNCADEYSNIVGETNQSYTATKSGSYAVEITQGNCADTSDCFEITIVDIFENDFGSDLIFYPNPNQGQISVDLGNLYTDVNTIVKNMTGQVVSIYDFGLVRKFNLEIEGTNGLYFIEIHTKESKKAIFKVIKD